MLSAKRAQASRPGKVRTHRDCHLRRQHPLHVEALEDRRLLTVSWTGNGNDGLWDDASNWSGMAVPGVHDDVMIGSTGNPTVTISDSEDVHSISVASGATLSLSTGAFLTVNASSTINGALAMAGAELDASGSGVVLAVDGATTVNDSGLEADSGAEIDLPELSTFSFTTSGRSFVANGGTIDLSDLSSIDNAAPSGGSFAFDAFGGGEISFGALASSFTPGLQFEASGAQSQIDLSSLTALTGARGELNWANGGSILTPQLNFYKKAA